MNLITVENITKSYGDRILFDIGAFGIGEGDKIGIIGVNGTGKSTLLKILVGAEYPDTGNVTTGNHVKIEYLSQNPYFDYDATVLQQVFKGNAPEMEVLREYEHMLEQVKYNLNNNALQEKLIMLNQKMDEMGVWQLESEAKTILTKLGISNFDAKIKTLSGGQRKRIALASALIQTADLLVLDEPTNHIDNETIGWLEEYLNKRKGALLMITHDRYFLDRVTNRIIELDGGELYKYTGNYSRFLEQKSEREERRYASEQKRQNLFRRELAWIKRGAKARTTKQKARIERFEKLDEEKLELSSEKIEISVGSRRLGKKVIELRNIYKSFGKNKCIDDFSYTVLKNDRIGIIGSNGIGKSTLLNIMTGRLDMDNGHIEKGETVKIGCFLQENIEMDGNLKVIEYIKNKAEFITTADGSKISASQMLERFLFSPTMQWTQIGRLSGGEKRRLYLLSVLMGMPNVLFLDEPTNDLDIQTLTILEEYLEGFMGAVIAISHDRYFLDKMAEKIFAFEGNGKIITYVGNYADYQEFRQKYIKNQEQPVHKKRDEKKHKSEKKKDKKLKFTFKEQREYEQIDEQIAQIEEKLETTNEEINQAGSNFEALQELVDLQEKLEKELEEKLERWTYLNELAEAIDESK
ncbi:ABC-F family ATP-binding cassette domain-containing protein [Marinisporobacter balticus]|uniref:ATP-binding cassette subfamily F protein uup n=1 Tax=Marinisporobacter balticus TaxID=2018667 RepID=A0A4R2KUM9_9FIRM|nr:ABC-F family ATP-binding cassette domain-containing protein [Marinisporobacter balticus]TCO74839.1 ATP-binding cassette subfamily F protein uup [Marinisporobacter balticus]